MSNDRTPASDVAFTPTVKAMQTRYGSRDDYDHSDEEADWQTHITPLFADFISRQTSIFFATANRTSSIAVARRASFTCLTTQPSPSSISPATASTSRSATSPTTPKRTSS